MDLNQKTGALVNTGESEGLRSFFGKVYNYMAGGLAVSGIAAYLSAKEPLLSVFYKVGTDGYITFTLWGWIAVLAPLVLIFMMYSAAERMHAGRAGAIYWVFSALMGVSLSNIFLLYSGSSIFQAFLVTAGTFFGMSIYGYTTKKSLAGWGSFLFMGLIGVILAMLVNIFLKSSILEFAVSIIAVFIFVGLTAYDTQRLKMIYNENDMQGAKDSKAVMGAVALYLDFINLFRLILYFLGDRR